MNKNQKIALIAGAAVLAIIVIATPVITNIDRRSWSPNYYYPFQVKNVLMWGGVVAVFTSLAFILLKEKD